jgi:hypothetical protein
MTSMGCTRISAGMSLVNNISSMGWALALS